MASMTSQRCDSLSGVYLMTVCGYFGRFLVKKVADIDGWLFFDHLVTSDSYEGFQRDDRGEKPSDRLGRVMGYYLTVLTTILSGCFYCVIVFYCQTVVIIIKLSK